jgi:hypothetical protein
MQYYKHGWTHPYFSVTLTVTLLDLKPENALVGLEKTLSLEDIVADEMKSPSPRKILPRRTIYLFRNDFSHPKSTPGRSKTTDFDAADRGPDISSPYPTELLSRIGSYTWRTLVVPCGYMEFRRNDAPLIVVVSWLLISWHAQALGSPGRRLFSMVAIPPMAESIPVIRTLRSSLIYWGPLRRSSCCEGLTLVSTKYLYILF